MKKLLYSLLFLGSISAYAQQSFDVVIVDGMLADQQFVTDNSANIKSKKLSNTVPNQFNELSTIATNQGINVYKLNDNYYDYISPATLNKQFKLEESNAIYFNGVRLDADDIKIVGDVLRNMYVAQVDGKNYLHIVSSK